MSAGAVALRLRVRFAETDQMGVAHHSAYVVWLEAARVEWLRKRGTSYREIEENGLSLAVSSLSVQYRSAAYFDDEIDIEVYLTEAKSRRLRYHYRLNRVADGVTLAIAETTQTPTDRSGRAIRLSEPWLAELKQYVETK